MLAFGGFKEKGQFEDLFYENENFNTSQRNRHVVEEVV